METEKQVFNPSIPYVGPIFGKKFIPGQVIRIQGTTPGVAKRFNVNLQCGPKIMPRDDIGMQVSMRILDNCISINSFHDGIWGEELRGDILPIKRARKFEVILMCYFSQYKVAINGQYFLEFHHRIHYDRITHLTIEGDVSVTQISYESASGGLTLGGATATHISFNPEDDETDEFEESTPVRASPATTYTPPHGFSRRPSYEAAIYGYPGRSTPQLINTTSGTPPRQIPVGLHGIKESPTSEVQPSPGAPDTTSIKHPAKRSEMQERCSTCGGLLIGGLFIYFFVFLCTNAPET